MTALLIAFWVLFGLEAIGTMTFFAVYILFSDWKVNPVGKHVAFYTGALSFVYLSTVAVMIWPYFALLMLLSAGHVAFAGAVWHRVWLVVREQRQAR